MTNEQINCPVIIAAKRSAVPRRPTRSTGASTLNAPSSPPVQTHQGVPLNCAAVGHLERIATWKSNRLAADTNADIIEAQSGAPPAFAAKFRLMAAWTTNEPPITKARKRRTKCIGRQLRRAKEFKQGSLPGRGPEIIPPVYDFIFIDEAQFFASTWFNWSNAAFARDRSALSRRRSHSRFPQSSLTCPFGI